MSSKTKIVVLRMKEIIYTIVFIALAILMISLLISMFRKKDSASETNAPVSDAKYTAGVYTASLSLNSQNISLEVTVDPGDYIKSIRFKNLDESVATMYPLMQTSLDSLASQIITNQSTDNLEISEGSEYTSKALISVINKALSKAQ